MHPPRVAIPRRRARLLAWALAAVMLGIGPAAPTRAVVPANFVDELVVGGLETPTDVEVAPDGRLFVAEKRGRVRIVENGALLPVPFLDLTDEVGNVADRGLMSITLHPDFASNGFVYLLYVVDPVFGQPDEGPDTVTFSRLTRYTANGNVAVPASRTILIGATPAEGFPSCYNTHAAGTVAFGLDGSMFISAGDGAHADRVDDGTNIDPYDADCDLLFGPEQDLGALRAQSDASLDGKVIRVDPDTAQGLPDNPLWDGDPDSILSKIWVRGFRNPFRFSVRPGSPLPGSLYVSDVGLSTWEEVSVARGPVAQAQSGNHGWPCWEGPTPNTGYQTNGLIGPVCDLLDPAELTPPLLAWHHSEPGAIGFTGSTATGSAFYEGASYPATYWGAFFFGDFVGDWIKVAFVDGSDQLVAVQDFADGVDSPVDLAYEPATESLLYVSIIGGEVRRIRFSLDNLAPFASASATPQGGAAPLLVQFSSDGTFDPDGDPITLEWDFGDGSPPTSQANPSHTYTTVGTFTATLVATDDQANVGTASVDVTTANEPPTVAITFPPDDYPFTDGELVQLQASADDPEGGPLTWFWDVRLVHNSHQHPEHFVSDQEVPPLVPFDSHGDFGDRFSYVVRVTVTDPVGLQATHEVRAIPVDAPPNQAPLAAFSAVPAAGDVPLVVNFDGSLSSDPDIDLIEHHWDFGDGATSTEEITTHIYSAPGVYPVTLTVTDVLGASSSLTQAVVARLPGLLALYDFGAEGGDLVPDISGVPPALDLTIQDPANVTWLPGGGLSIDAPTAIRALAPGTKFRDAVVATEEFSVEAWIEAADLVQAGPARIVTLSQDPFPNGGNFTLGQVADTWEGRIRTTVTDSFGNPPLTLPAGEATTALTHLVFTRDTAGATSLYIDGVRRGIGTARGTLANWNPAFELVVGNEPTGDRPWLGTVHEVAVYAQALDEVQVQQSFAAGPGVVASAPLILLPPADGLAEVGGTFTFQTVAFGASPLSYQWQRLSGTWQDVPGATSSSYTTPAATLADDGAQFRVVVDNALGTGVSAPATLFVVDAVDASVQLALAPAGMVVDAGDDAPFTITAQNPGNVDLTQVSLSAPDCDALSGPSGDANADDRLQPGEVWSWSCTAENVLFPFGLGAEIAAQALDGTGAFASASAPVEVTGAPGRVAAGLVAYYPFDEGAGGVVHDASGVASPLDLTVANPSHVRWRAGGGLSVESVTVIATPGAATSLRSALQATGAVTLEAWVRPGNATQFGPARILAFSQDAFPNGGNFMLGQTTSAYNARLRTSTTDVFGLPQRNADAAAAAGQLAHLLYTRDAAGAEALYVDGAQVFSGTRTGDFSGWGSYVLALANEPNGSRGWLGTLHLVALYDRALSPAEALQNRDAGPGGTAPPLCGNGALDGGEACDDGNVLPGDGCRANCTLELCGDGLLDPGEDCDDANASAGDGCRADCTEELCGDGLLDPGEACDDGNTAAGDGCDAACAIEPPTTCGDGVLDVGLGEECDDGNNDPGDGCRADCTVELCGDGLLDPGEACEIDAHCGAGEFCAAGCACAASVALEASLAPPAALVASGADATFTFTASNVGSEDLSAVAVSAPDCDLLLGPGGDDGDGVLEPGESWTWECTLQGVLFPQGLTLEVTGQAGTPASAEAGASLDVVGAPARVGGGLLALYRFDEGGGDVVGDSAGGFDLAPDDPSRVRWRAGGGLALEQPTGLVGAGPATAIIDAVKATDALSVEAWVRPANATQFGPARIVAISQDPFPSGGSFVLGQSTTNYDVRLRTANTDIFGLPTLSVPAAAADELAHLVFTREPGGAEAIYVDGALATSSVRPGSLVSWFSGHELVLGNEPTLDRGWLGTFYLVAIYDRELDAAEIAQNHAAGPGGGAAACANGLDDDGDGWVDFVGGDPGCDSELDASERSALLVCDDGVDNDGDGRADYDPATRFDPSFQAGAGDPACLAPTWNAERTACQNGAADDADGLHDFDGGQSIHGACAAGVCPPGVSDPDLDGVADPDPSCVGRPWRKRETPSNCGLGAELALFVAPLLVARRMRRRRAG